MVDTGVVGCSWIELPAGKYSFRNQIQNDDGTGISPCSNFTMIGRDKVFCPNTRCQIEVDISYKTFVSHHTDEKWQV